MANNVFQRNETIICSITITDADSVAINPDTSMTITITDCSGDVIIDGVAMTNDAVGSYHYDYNPATDAELGGCKIRYKATNNSRLTIVDDYFNLRA